MHFLVRRPLHLTKPCTACSIAAPCLSHVCSGVHRSTPSDNYMHTLVVVITQEGGSSRQAIVKKVGTDFGVDNATLIAKALKSGVCSSNLLSSISCTRVTRCVRLFIQLNRADVWNSHTSATLTLCVCPPTFSTFHFKQHTMLSIAQIALLCACIDASIIT